MKNIFCRGFMSFAFTIVAATTSYAQNRSLKIGDLLPESFWTTPFPVVNHSQKTIYLSEDKNKLILIHFWSTWCSACLMSLPKIETLQQKFENKVKILPVSSQDKAALEKFFTSSNGKKYKSMRSIYEDKKLHNLFPHAGVPFIIWIKDGKLFNTTDAGQLTEQTINEVLSGDKSSLQTIIQINRERPLMLSEDYDRQRNVQLLNYSFFAKGQIPDIGAGGTYRKTASGKIHGRQFTNLSLWDMYYAIGFELFRQQEKASFTEKRMIIEVKEPEQLMPIEKADGSNDGANLYNYEFIIPEQKSSSLYNYMLEDLNRYSGYTVTLEKRPVKCFVLVRTSKKDKLTTKGGEKRSTFPRTPSILRNVPLKNMVNMLNGEINIKELFIDQTGYTGNVDLEVSGVKDIATLKKELQKYDLDLIPEERDVLMMVIKDQQN
ncbi:TlpA family protein disulfide reductase [Chryseobacterium indoltheticum]|uniref:TlpA family protein disulfide reductase n=1 Tax=Chryseobacterium indoltheticum TaxID=254 RepID=A0A3G6N3I9_9FLAO|nr:TlpA disulfide reductase family protein [Chryseobacterium indoltheticum]AZA60086.1 TlpA family protein disulfide reductase [Chryseobacterium indoltheticum]